MPIKRHDSDFAEWRARSSLTPERQQIFFLLGGIAVIILAATVLTLL